MRYYIYSTLTNDYAYTNWHPPASENDPTREIQFQCLIKGGANRANDRLITPKGVRTEVTEQQHDELHKNTTFQKHLKQGFILVMTSKEDPEEVATAGMKARDGSAPLTPDHPMFKGTAENTPKPEKKGIVERVKEAFE